MLPPIPDDLRPYFDIGLVVAIIFGGGVMWQKVDSLAHDLVEIKAAVETDRRGGQAGMTSTVDRLARLETQMRVVVEQQARIEDKLDRALRRN